MTALVANGRRSARKIGRNIRSPTMGGTPRYQATRALSVPSHSHTSRIEFVVWQHSQAQECCTVLYLVPVHARRSTTLPYDYIKSVYEEAVIVVRNTHETCVRTYFTVKRRCYKIALPLIRENGQRVQRKARHIRVDIYGAGL